VDADSGAVVVEGGALPSAVCVLPAKPLPRGLGEGRAGTDHAGKGAGAGLGQQLVEDGLSATAREVASGGPAASGPRGPKPALDLAAVGQAELHVPLGSAGALDEEGVARDRATIGAELLERVHGPTVSREWEDVVSRK
jgi:hypothetical protein